MLACITFHFREERLKYLRRSAEAIASLQFKKKIIIVTNTESASELDAIKAVCPKAINTEVVIAKFPHLQHPWILTWCHKGLMKDGFESKRYGYFLLIEDDIEVTRIGIKSWIEHREALRTTRFFPSFLRVEYSDEKKTWVSTDIKKQIEIKTAPKVLIKGSDFAYLNATNPYQGMFFYDDELMKEHVNSYTFDYRKYGRFGDLDKYPGWGGGGVAERANNGITFLDPPNGFNSRNLLPYFCKYESVDQAMIIRHMDPVTAKWGHMGFGSLALSDLIKPEFDRQTNSEKPSLEHDNRRIENQGQNKG